MVTVIRYAQPAIRQSIYGGNLILMLTPFIPSPKGNGFSDEYYIKFDYKKKFDR